MKEVEPHLDDEIIIAKVKLLTEINRKLTPIARIAELAILGAAVAGVFTVNELLFYWGLPSINL